VALPDKMICVQIGSGEIRLSCGNIQRPFVNRVNAQKAKWKIWQKSSKMVAERTKNIVKTPTANVF